MSTSRSAHILLLITLTTMAATHEVTASERQTAEARVGYDDARARLAARRAVLARELRDASTRLERRAVYARARASVIEALTLELFPAWEGTEWSFSGTSETPGVGHIACGMFVGTLLDHAGFQLDRIALGRLASEHIALSLTGRNNLRRYRDRPAEEVTKEVVARGEGIYAVGLDYHAGFIHVDPAGDAWFIHSTVVGEGRVIREPLLGDNPFGASRYRIVSKLMDDGMMKKWLLGQTFEARDLRR